MHDSSRTVPEVTDALGASQFLPRRSECLTLQSGAFRLHTDSRKVQPLVGRTPDAAGDQVSAMIGSCP